MKHNRKIRIFSPNHSCAPLRKVRVKTRTLLRFGSITPLHSKYKYRELNSIEGIRISSNKIKMKQAFDKVKIHHSEWLNTTNINKALEFIKQHKIIIAKNKHSSKGEGIYYIDSIESFNNVLKTESLSNLVLERYYFFPQEYRVHVDRKYGCFYACKKLINDEGEVQWHKHANTASFMMMNPQKSYPFCWDSIIEDCKQFMEYVSLDITCFDVLCNNTEFIIVESNTAPSLGPYGLSVYINHLNKYYGI